MVMNMSFCSRIINSTVMQYVYAGAGAAATVASYVGANIQASNMATIAKVFGENCPEDSIGGPFSSALCDALSSQSFRSAMTALGLYGVAGTCATVTAYAIWRARHIRQLNGQEGRALIAQDHQPAQCCFLAKRPFATNYLAASVSGGGLLLFGVAMISSREVAVQWGKCIANLGSRYCTNFESRNTTVTTINNIIVSAIGLTWAGTWGLAAIKPCTSKVSQPSLNDEL